MDLKTKAVVAVLPFIGAIGVGASLAMPAYNDYTTKQQTVDEKKAEEEQLAEKLKGKTKLLSDKKLLEADVEKLRGSVPKKPDLEILNIDLEKMCRESNLDLISFKEAGKDQLKAAGMDEDPSQGQTSAQLLKNKIKAGARNAGGAAGSSTPGGGSGGAAGSKKDKDAASASTDTGLSKVTMSVKCIGDYAALMEFVKKMETYQRVLAISELKASVPRKLNIDKNKKLELPDDAPATESEEQGDWRQLNISFLLTAYYLP
jgi:Tfp pilus assembly protein PilO